jgi:hypothetical protein
MYSQKEIIKEISEIRNGTITNERIKKRKKYEDIAKQYIINELPKLNMEKFEKFLSLLDSDFYNQQEIEGRFFPLFNIPNINRIKKNYVINIEKLIKLIIDEDFDKIDECLSFLNGISYGFVSLLFYIFDSNKYNIFLNSTFKGINNLYPIDAKNLRYGKPFKNNYILFNKFCNNFKKEYSVEPQEMDILLVNFGRTPKVIKPEPNIKDDSKKIVEPDKFLIKTHPDAEGVLLKIGNLLGFDTYTSDKSKKFGNETLDDIATLPDVPDVLQSIQGLNRVDVIWFNESTPEFCFFEVEDKGTMREALHRLYQARVFNGKFFIVGPPENEEKFEKYATTAPFKTNKKMYVYRTFEELESLYHAVKEAEEKKENFGIK